MEERKEFSLFELNGYVKQAMNVSFPDTYWVRAEMSDVRLNASSGHCYLEFIEKNGITGQMVARARGSIWAKTFRMLKPYFEMETGQLFSSGLKVLVKVTVEFHELYGFSLTVLDIDPAYTMGDLMRRRMEILHQLQEEGVLDLNKELPFPDLPTRIAVITSPTAAGYEDFLNQLNQNRGRYPFYTRLFPAIMQGERTEESIIMALEQIYEYIDLFDVVVIIRGGGSTSDLNCFDSYLLANNCAQFPLPVITGIGHERDDTVLDMVAHTRVKTPTAAAEFLINRMDMAAVAIEELQYRFNMSLTERLQTENQILHTLGSRLPVLAMNRIEQCRYQLQVLAGRFPVASYQLVNMAEQEVRFLRQQLKSSAERKLKEGMQFVELTGQYVQMSSPDYILKKGYSLTLKEGKIIKKAAGLVSSDEIVTRFADGEVHSKVTKK